MHLLSVTLVPDLIAVIGKEGQEERIQTRCVELLHILVLQLRTSTLALQSVRDVKVLVGGDPCDSEA